MQFVPKGSPSPANDASRQSPMSARERAISMIQGQNTNPVPNPTQVSPEEMGAVIQRQPEPTLEAEVGQPGTSEDAAEKPSEAEATKPKEEPLSSQFAVLARKEKAFRLKQQEFKAKEEALAAREAQLVAKDSEYGEKFISKDRLSSDPWSVLAELGISYDQITQAALNQPQQDPATKAYLTKLEAKIAELEGHNKKTQQSFEDQQKQSYEQAVAQIRTEAKSLVQSDEAYEMIRDTGSLEDVVDLIKQTFEQDGVLLSVHEAAQQVEDYLVEEALKITKSKKIQQKLAPSKATEQKQPAGSQQSPQASAPKTLTNSVSASRPMTARERAIAAFNGKKNA